MLENSSQKDFERFLAALDTDSGRAAEKYVALRDRLERFFEWRNCENASELTDIVFDRVMKKIDDGEEIRSAEAYSATVAKFVLMENRREILKNRELDENSMEVADGNEPDGTDEKDELETKRLRCLDRCLEGFPADQSGLLIDYFDTDEETLIPTRQRLAKKLGINLNSLRIRVCRLKSKLEKCMRECCGERGGVSSER
jgi:DNA-directed RNA polymerase specialized sigma24 family protein